MANQSGAEPGKVIPAFLCAYIAAWGKRQTEKNRYRAVIAIVIAGIVFLTFPRAEERNFRELLMENTELELLNALCPVIAAAGDNGRLSVSGWIFPFLGYQSKTKTAQLAQENSDMVEKILLAEGRDEYTGMSGDDTEKKCADGWQEPIA